jgi:HK97 family phage major capsid protein
VPSCPYTPRDQVSLRTRKENNLITNHTPEQRAKINAAFRDYLKSGSVPNIPETRDLNTATDGAGGALVAQIYSKEWIEAQRQYGPLAGLVSVSRNTNGGPLKVSVYSDVASTMSLLTEGSSTSSTEIDPTMFSTIAGGADTLISTVLFSKQEAADADDIGEFLKRIAFSRVSRATEYALLTGRDNGTNSQLTHSPVGGLLAAAPVGVSAVATTGPTQAQLKALAASVDVSYQNAPGAGFYVNPITFAFLVAKETSTGESLYKFNGDTLYIGKWPVYVSAANSMPSYSTSGGAVTALFGDYSRAYKFVDVGGPRLQILTQRFADQFVNQAVISQRLASAALVSGAVKSMTTA